MTTWLMIAGGDCTDMRFCRSVDEVRAFIAGALYSPPEAMPADELDTWMANFQNPDDWAEYSWRVDLEDGHISAIECSMAFAAPMHDQQRDAT